MFPKLGEDGAPVGKQTGGMGPLVIPVSVPVSGGQGTLGSPWRGRMDPGDHHRLAHSNHKLSVIVARRRSLRGSLSESSAQVRRTSFPFGVSLR